MSNRKLTTRFWEPAHQLRGNMRMGSVTMKPLKAEIHCNNIKMTICGDILCYNKMTICDAVINEL